MQRIYILFRNFYWNKKREAYWVNLKLYYKLFQKLKFAISSPAADKCNVCEPIPLNFIKIHRITGWWSKKGFMIVRGNNTKLWKKFSYVIFLKILSLLSSIMHRIYHCQYWMSINQFYLRLLWLHNFNAHTHNDKESTFFTFYEHEAKKDGNSIVLFIYHFLAKKGVFNEDSPTYWLILLSSNAEGQNKNFTIIKYCIWISKRYNLEFQHLFPVPGHSFLYATRTLVLVSEE